MKKREKDKQEFLETAKELLKFVGPENFNKLLNCFVRVRFHVIDRNLVDTEAIKKLDLVKDIVWSANELQVIIGTNAFKVREQIELLQKNNDTNTTFELKVNKDDKSKKNKQSFGKRFIQATNGILVPLIPLFVASGVISGISAILAAPSIGLIKGGIYGPGKFVTDMDLWSGIFYILSNSGMSLMSIFFCYSTVKYFNGNPVIGIFIGLLICSRFFLRDFDKFGSLTSGKWVLEQLGDFKLTIKGYNSSIIPAIGAALIYVYSDHLIKKILPSVLDMVLRPVLTVLITFFAAFFIILPILDLITSLLGEVAVWFYYWPLGLGGFLMGFFFQPLNVVGLSWPVYLSLEIPWMTEGAPMRTQNILDASTLSMFGAMLALWIKETNYKSKGEIASLGLPIFAGIITPTLFGALLKRPKAFWLANFGAGLIGLLLFHLDVTRPDFGGMGFIGVLGFGDDTYRLSLFVGISILGIILNFGLIYFFYNDKKNEHSLIKKTLSNAVNFAWIKLHKQDNLQSNKASYFELRKELQEINLIYKQNSKLNVEYRKDYIKYHHVLNKFLKLKQHFEIQQEKYHTKIDKAKNDQQIERLTSKLGLIEEKYYSHHELNQQVKELKANLDLKTQQLTSLNEDLFNKSKLILENFLNKYHLVQLEDQLTSQLWNAINDNLIVGSYLQPKQVEISKSEFYQTKNKYLLKFLPKIHS